MTGTSHTLDELTLLLPCHGLDDFPVEQPDADAESLLAAWTSPFHPHLVAALGKMFRWVHVESPPTLRPGAWVIAPTVSLQRLDPAYRDDAIQGNHGGRFFTASAGRAALTRELLAALADDGTPSDPPVRPDLVADFWALGFAYLQVELLTRQMRYSSSLDQAEFERRLVEAARAAVAADEPAARERLSACFDLLAQQRDHYYPVDVFMLDMMLVEPSTVGPELTGQLELPVPINLVLTARTLDEIVRRAPDVAERLREGAVREQIGMLTNGSVNIRVPGVPAECLLENLQSAIQTFEQTVGRAPHAYGGRQALLGPVLPRLLTDLDLGSAWHMALDGSTFPTSHQSKTTWEGWGGASVSAVARPPVDARKHAPLLRLAMDLGESMDMDYVAMRCWVRWPTDHSEYFQDLRRTAQHSPVLGKFVTWSKFISDSPDTGQWDRFGSDQYSGATLESTSTDPVSQSIRFWQRWASLWQQRLLVGMLAVLGDEPPAGAERPYVALLDDEERSPSAAAAVSDGASQASIAGDGTPDEPDRGGKANEAQRSETLARKVAERLGFTPLADQRAGASLLVLNSLPMVRRQAWRFSGEFWPADGEPVYATCRQGEGSLATVDVPASGFVTVRSRPSPPPAPDATVARVVDQHLLQNEFLEAKVDAQTGGLIALRDFGGRLNRLSQLLAIRQPAPGSDARRPAGRYTTMIADRIEIVESSPMVGRIRSEGRLIDANRRPVASYRQEFTLWRGARVLDLDIELDLATELVGSPWDNYLAARFAWANEGAIVHRGIHLARQATEAQRFEAPLFVELDQQDALTTIFCFGAPYHRRVGLRGLDTLLIVPGERQRKFRLGLGIDIKYPVHEAVGRLAPPLGVWADSSGLPAQDRGWLLHVDARNVLISDIQPIGEDQGRRGIRVHLEETMGRTVRTYLRTARPMELAQQVDFRGYSMRRLSVDAVGCALDVGAHDFMAIELFWAGT